MIALLSVAHAVDEGAQLLQLFGADAFAADQRGEKLVRRTVVFTFHPMDSVRMAAICRAGMSPFVQRTSITFSSESNSFMGAYTPLYDRDSILQQSYRNVNTTGVVF